MAATAVNQEEGVVQKGWPRVHVAMQNTQVPTQRSLPDVVWLVDPLRSRSERSLYLFVADQGTRVWTRSDLRSLLASTMLAPAYITFEPEPIRSLPITRMARIRELADLSLREWATVFGVTHTAIKQWLSSEPDRDKLPRVLDVLEEAGRYRGDLSSWLRRALPGSELTPLDLLRRDRWRAFRGALRARPAAPATMSADDLRRRRQEDESWAIPEAPAVSTE